MKTTLFTIFALIGASSFSQKDINLNLIHNYNGTPFAYGQTYSTSGGTAVSFDRVQYYLSGFEITHDGGQTLAMPDAYVLASGNITSYNMGNEDVTTVEGLSFDFGVDNASNHLGTSSWPAEHPLAAQSPSMDWGWPSGYFFFVIDGMIDDTGDGTPNKVFELRGIGDALLRDVNDFTAMSITGSSIELAIDANIADWIMNIDLVAASIDHSGGPNNVQVSDNTNDETVFTISSLLDVESIETEESKIYANYETVYAPTIFYNLATQSDVDIKVYNLNGQVQLESSDEGPEGNFFINKELPVGSYLIVFSNEDIEESFRFVVGK
ncbi:MAG: T9SS type A sorting domain-containing protein [Crocinitomicaceae bacterium]|jgi:hypothetical protein|nr:T9SS type A sorting domain-containing protein [Crocinitomicaceae bacterium]